MNNEMYVVTSPSDGEVYGLYNTSEKANCVARALRRAGVEDALVTPLEVE